MTLQEKTIKIIRRLLVLTSEKKCNWKYERLLINDNDQAMFFDSYKTNLKSGWVAIYKNSKDGFIIGFGKSEALIYSECYDAVTVNQIFNHYHLLKTLYKEILALHNPDGEIIDLILKELEA